MLARRSIVLIAALILSFVTIPAAATAAAAPDPAPPLSSSEQRELVPAYFAPDHPRTNGSSRWRKLCTVAKRGSVVIINPNSGPGTEFSAGYDEVIRFCRQNGYKVIGYVHTALGRYAQSLALSEIDHYHQWYVGAAALDGIFLDQMANNSAAPSRRFPVVTPQQPISAKNYYKGLYDRVKSWINPSIVVGNPGNVSESQGNWQLSTPVVNVLVVHENNAAAYRTWQQPTWVYPGTNRSDATRIAHLVHGAPRFPAWQEKALIDLSRARHAGYVYVTDEVGTPTDPLWNVLPTSWNTRLPVDPPPVIGATVTENGR